MAKTITATFESVEAVKNAVFDLMGSQIPRDRISINETDKQIEVFIPEASEPEITDLLKRHNPKDLT